VIDALKGSFEHLRQVALNLSDADLEKPVKLFGQDTTYEVCCSWIANHMHEHLASPSPIQTNGVTPPWSKKGEN